MSSPSSQLLATHANCLPVGTRVADFEIIGLIGEGGFGIVYLAKDTSLDRVVALKEFMPAAFAGRVDGVELAGIGDEIAAVLQRAGATALRPQRDDRQP